MVIVSDTDPDSVDTLSDEAELPPVHPTKAKIMSIANTPTTIGFIFFISLFLLTKCFISFENFTMATFKLWIFAMNPSLYATKNASLNHASVHVLPKGLFI
ncbi:MAG: hypothetical protein Q4P17_11565 [Methanobacterium sp.]|nr:hypothetical protein [Methanobacterium sp.]